MAMPSLLYLKSANSARHSTAVLAMMATCSTLMTSVPAVQIWSL